MTRVKVCGVCRAADAAAAAAAGADYIGVILAAGFSRTRTRAEARAILAAAGGVARAGVFVDGDVASVVSAVESLALDVVQLHGAETPEHVAALRGAGPWRVWKAVRPRDRAEFAAAVHRYAAVADALLVDGWSAAAAGGVGARFPWAEIARERNTLPEGVALVVAGGLNADNVTTALALLAPDVVDVSSGVEAAPGEKSAARIVAFVRAVRGGEPAASLSNAQE